MNPSPLMLLPPLCKAMLPVEYDTEESLTSLAEEVKLYNCFGTDYGTDQKGWESDIAEVGVPDADEMSFMHLGRGLLNLLKEELMRPIDIPGKRAALAMDDAAFKE